MRIQHGQVPSLEQLSFAQNSLRAINREIPLPFSIEEARENRFDYLFPHLQRDPSTVLPELPQTRTQLIELGVAMREPRGAPSLDSATPSAYTYFGQFVDHDITFEVKSDTLRKLDDPNLAPLPPQTIESEIRNSRSPFFDLDSVYGKPAVRDGEKMKLGIVSPNPVRPPGKDDFNDLPRFDRSTNPATDRTARVGDLRNDENLVIAQMHVAFLRAHNALIDKGLSFDDAKKILRRHYQWIVVHDFLKRIADPEIVNRILLEGNRFYQPNSSDAFMPLEFSVAAYRFGHSMVRGRYDYNVNFSGERAASLGQLFTFTTLSGTLGDFPSLPENWIIQWRNFLDEGTNFAHQIDTTLVEPLFELMAHGGPAPNETRLAVRNLLRGYMLRLPTGQGVARSMGIDVLSPDQLRRIAERISPQQRNALEPFLEGTPLWYYILAESSLSLSSFLGPVGSTIVAEVLIGLIRASKDSFLRIQDWKPTLGTNGRFTLRDLLKFGDSM